MIETLQLEETPTQLHDVPKLLVDWSSPWEEFRSSIRPAFGRSGARLAGEAPYGMLPYRGMSLAMMLEAFLLFVVIVIPRQIDRLRPYVAPKIRSHEVIYYSGDELPRTEDVGGAQAGATGRAGGQEAFHHTQTIHVARGNSLAAKIVDAPDLKLATSTEAVANLLAFKPIPGVPPTEGLHAALTLPSLPANVVAPPPRVSPDRSRGGLTLESVVPPAPAVSRDKPLVAPALNSAVIAPAPNVSREHTLVAPALNSTVVAPAPSVTRDGTLTAPALNASVIAPAPSASREKVRSAPALAGAVIPPAPSSGNSEITRTPVQMNSVAVVPPPITSAERDSVRDPKLTLPPPSVIAPPPSPAATADLRRLASGGGDPFKAVVPPPPTSSNSGIVGTLIGKIFGTQEVVPPPPSVSQIGAGGTSRANPNGPGGISGSAIVPPPPSVAATPGGSSRGMPGGTGRLSGSSVVAPPPTVGGSGSSLSGSTRGASLSPDVVPPPPSVSAGVGHGQGNDSGNGAGGEGTLLADNVVPPPPSLGSNSGPSGTGLGRKGVGLGGPGDAGSVQAPPSPGGGSGGGKGLVLTNQPGSKIGAPSGGRPGAIAMSPAGGDKPGLGGADGGAGIGHGDGPGSGMTGEGTGAGKAGTGRGSDPNARGGISPTPGPGGAGRGTSGSPAFPGADIRGGSTNIVNLPSFGENGSAPSQPARSSVKQQTGPAITIVATSRSGGAFNRYGELPGDNYTVYFDTQFGPASLQFADPGSGSETYTGTLIGPQPLRIDLPPGLPRSELVVRCVLEASGNLRVLSLLEGGHADVTVKILSALPKWKFRPAMRGDQPLQVQAILGFNINTDDHY